jgi:hypothetical protein
MSLLSVPWSAVSQNNRDFKKKLKIPLEKKETASGQSSDQDSGKNGTRYLRPILNTAPRGKL